MKHFGIGPTLAENSPWLKNTTERHRRILDVAERNSVIEGLPPFTAVQREQVLRELRAIDGGRTADEVLGPSPEPCYTEGMEKTIVRDVRDITGRDRDVLEHALGEKLRDNQRLVVQVLTLSDVPETAAGESGVTSTELPDWCDVFRGLSDAEVAEVERTTRQRLNLSRDPA